MAIIVKRLKDHQYARLKDVFEDEFDSDLPYASNSEILAAYEDGKMVGFVMIGDVKLVGQIYVIPEKRSKSHGIVTNILNHIRGKYDGKETTAAVASEPRFGKLFESLGMQKIDGTFYRKNIDF